MTDPITMRDELLAYLRSQKNQAELAKRMGMSHSWVSKFCCGHIKFPRVTELVRLHAWMIEQKAEGSHK